MNRVLLVGSDKKNIKSLKSIFDSVELICDTAPTMEAALEKIPQDPPVLVVADRPAQPDALQVLSAVLKNEAPATPFIVTLALPNVEDALQAMRAGAFDCVVKPVDRFDVLAAAKRAAARNRRTLFVEKVTRPTRRLLRPLAMVLSVFLFIYGLLYLRSGSPPYVISLGSAHLGGIQWEDRTLWVSDWIDSTITAYKASRGFRRKSRKLDTEGIYRMRDTTPIYVCNTPEVLLSIGMDLKIRSHYRAIELPTLLSVKTPGSQPTGMAWDGENFWTVDKQTGLLYRHSEDLRVLDTEPSLVDNPVALAYGDGALWVMGEKPLRLARLESTDRAMVWSGPYPIYKGLQEGVVPSGMSVAFGRLWLVSGGDPKLVSVGLKKILEKPTGWTREQKVGEEVES